MNFRRTTLFLFLISGPMALAMQAGSTVMPKLREIHINAESQAVQNQATEARKRLLLVKENAQIALAKVETDKSPAAQAEAANAQKQVAAAQSDAENAQKKASELPSQQVTEQDWKQMQTVLQTFKDRFETSMKHYSALATTLVVAGIFLALVSALAGFLRKSLVAGIISILVSGVVGVPKVLPIIERAEYFRVLFGQSSSLLVQSQLRLHPTTADYNEFVKNINLLTDYETNKFPAGGDVAANTQSLIKDIAASAAQ